MLPPVCTQAYAKLNTTEHELFRALHDPLHKVWEQRKVRAWVVASEGGWVYERVTVTRSEPRVDGVGVASISSS